MEEVRIEAMNEASNYSALKNCPDKMWEKYYSLSPYVYSHNNPLVFKDPSGFDDDGTNCKTYYSPALIVEADRDPEYQNPWDFGGNINQQNNNFEIRTISNYMPDYYKIPIKAWNVVRQIPEIKESLPRLFRGSGMLGPISNIGYNTYKAWKNDWVADATRYSIQSGIDLTQLALIGLVDPLVGASFGAISLTPFLITDYYINEVEPQLNALQKGLIDFQFGSMP
ncbi:MAG: hypothetical protein NT007_02840 [Candidatus Kapabacteria bacterium]|nr:hypothetical protein [Candidatus Kapabacteria bacterium]